MSTSYDFSVKIELLAATPHCNCCASNTPCKVYIKVKVGKLLDENKCWILKHIKTMEVLVKIHGFNMSSFIKFSQGRKG